MIAPAVAVGAAERELERELHAGRAKAHFERRSELTGALRKAYAATLGCAPEELALTSSTTEGMALTIAGLDLQAGSEILTSDEEHPGLLGALVAARELRGVEIREAPLAELAEAVGPRTALVACSHVGWMSGSFAPAELSQLEVPVLLDGGVRRGADVVKALALGASLCLIARPQLWGLAVAGEAGVARVLEIFRNEIDRVTGLCGVTKISEIGADLIHRPNIGSEAARPRDFSA